MRRARVAEPLCSLLPLLAEALELRAAARLWRPLATLWVLTVKSCDFSSNKAASVWCNVGVTFLGLSLAVYIVSYTLLPHGFQSSCCQPA